MGKLLLVDDAAYMRRLIGIMAKNGGHEIVGEAGTGNEAIEKFTDLAPDLVILDILMPDCSGIEVLKELKTIKPDTKVVMCTASEQSHHIKEALALGASGYIVKPFTQTILLEKINTALAGVS